MKNERMHTTFGPANMLMMKKSTAKTRQGEEVRACPMSEPRQSNNSTVRVTMDRPTKFLIRRNTTNKEEGKESEAINAMNEC